MPNRILALLKSRELLLLSIIFLLAALTHGFNMFHFPYYEDDEGTYMSQAWAVTDLGKLSPYTYFYDHAPAGWLLIALWTKLTGGFFSFGFSVNSGRVFMLLLFLFSALLLYLITRKLTGSFLFAVIALIFFSFSPLGIYFQRRVLLDNIMIFWVLLSLYLTLYLKAGWSTVLLSGILMGIAIITKENAIFFIPGLLYAVWSLSREKRIGQVFGWLGFASIPVLLYFLYALIRGEFFPYGSPLGGLYPHVSLIGTWMQQVGRPGGSILNLQSLFWQSLSTWYRGDPVIIFLGIASTIINLLLSFRFFASRLAAIFSVSFILFLVRGGVVFDFYILPILPVLALNIAVALWGIVRFAHQKISGPIISVLLFPALLIMSFDLFFFGSRSEGNFNLFSSDQTSGQINAVNWILSQNTARSFYVIDNYAYVDLHARQDNHFRFAEYYWKVDEDPNISLGILHNDWRNISFIALTPQMKRDVSNNNLPLSRTALDNSGLMTSFVHDGWGVDIRRVNSNQ